MFTIRATFEDTHITATSAAGHTYTVGVHDALTYESRVVELTAQQLSYVLQFNLHPDGEPTGFEQMYQELEPIFKDWPNHLRPIP